MSNCFGKNFKINIFGESHGESIGVIIEGIPSGIKLNLDRIQWEMNRRRPGKNDISTSRNEKDKVLIQSGFFNGKTTGSSLCGIIKNTNKKSKDYSNLINNVRPSHADYPSRIKYNGYDDYRGGGKFSGRLTAPLVFAGAIAKQLLKEKGIFIGSHIASIYNVLDKKFNELDDLNEDILEKLKRNKIPTLDPLIEEKMEEIILEKKESKNSVGGIVEGIILNMPVGIGEPLMDSFESCLSHLLFSIPGVKGVSFGEGFDISKMTGKEANDEYYMDKSNEVKTYTNNNGGILGGLTTGMPVVFNVAFKPTPSIGIKQKTVNIKSKENVELKIDGRHDPCIVPRALVVVEAAAAIVALDLLIEGEKYER